MIFEKLVLEKGDRMVRIGAGQNKGRWFFRVDLWAVGFRVRKNGEES